MVFLLIFFCCPLSLFIFSVPKSHSTRRFSLSHPPPLLLLLRASSTPSLDSAFGCLCHAHSRGQPFSFFCLSFRLRLVAARLFPTAANRTEVREQLSDTITIEANTTNKLGEFTQKIHKRTAASPAHLFYALIRCLGMKCTVVFWFPCPIPACSTFFSVSFRVCVVLTSEQGKEVHYF